MKRTARIICVGNSMAGDDAAGPAVFARLRRRGVPADVRLDLLACGGLDLLGMLDGSGVLVVVDAVCFGARPGTLHLLDWADLPAAGRAVSAHGIGVREALAAGRLLLPRAMPRRVTLVGIEGESFDGLGAPLSAPVAAAVPRAARAALQAARPEAG